MARRTALRRGGSPKPLRAIAAGLDEKPVAVGAISPPWPTSCALGLLSRAPSRGLLEPCARENQSTISIVSVWVGWNSTLVRMQRAGVQASPLVTRQKRSTSSGEAGTATSWFVHTALACAESGSMGTWRSSRGAGPRTSRRSRRRRSSYPVSDHSAVEPGASSTTSSPNPTRIGATSLGIAPSRRYSGVIRTWSRWPR
jgi:hypothetical protein